VWSDKEHILGAEPRENKKKNWGKEGMERME
jgi:hypothetical protein